MNPGGLFFFRCPFRARLYLANAIQFGGRAGLSDIKPIEAVPALTLLGKDQ
jgi:hypothetical protein